MGNGLTGSEADINLCVCYAVEKEDLKTDGSCGMSSNLYVTVSGNGTECVWRDYCGLRGMGKKYNTGSFR